MASVAVIALENDTINFHRRYMLGPILNVLKQMGHEVAIHAGVPPAYEPAHLAIMHVDLSVVPKPYLDYAAQYPLCLNFKPSNILKRTISGALIDETTPWSGPVIVKSNWNYCGIPEVRLNRRAVARHLPPPVPEVTDIGNYHIFRSRSDVPREAFKNPSLVVEKFIPEQDDGEFAIRFWSFAGSGERCARVFSKSPIVKASEQTHFEFCEVPHTLRRRREELGFDFGKFDFVMHDGEPVLLDANKTPGSPPVEKTTWQIDYANGILQMLEKRT